MATINLLPTQLTLKGRDKAIVEGAKKFVFIGFILLILASLAIAGYLVFMSVRIRASINSEEVLKKEISSFQQAEQSLFLIKDRIGKIKTVLGKESANSQVATLAEFLQTGPGDLRILEIQITPQKVTLSLIFPSSASFGGFYKLLIGSNLYPNILLKSFSFNPSIGYLVTFELSQK